MAISTVSYATGFRPPLEEISAELRRRGILLYLDGTQSLGALQFDVARIQPDLFAVDAYKWLLSPNGAGFMYVSPELRERLAPAVIGWRSHKDWRNHENLHHGSPEFAAEAEKYEGGMLPFALLYAMDAVIEMVQAIGPERIEQRVIELASQTRDVLRAAGAVLPGGQRPHYDSQIVTARFPGRDAPPSRASCWRGRCWSPRGMAICGFRRIFITKRTCCDWQRRSARASGPPAAIIRRVCVSKSDRVISPRPIASILS